VRQSRFIRRLAPGSSNRLMKNALRTNCSSPTSPSSARFGLPTNPFSLTAGIRLDFVVEQTVVLEIKTVESLHPIHEAQLLTYLKLGGWRIGLLINFNVPVLTKGTKRMVNNLK
jgi:GxxExxY protein